jgi:hypothetical protein
MGFYLVIQELPELADALGHIFFIDLVTFPKPVNQVLTGDDAISFLNQIKKDIEALSADWYRNGSAKQ